MMEKIKNVGMAMFWIANGVICLISGVWSFVMVKELI